MTSGTILRPSSTGGQCRPRNGCGTWNGCAGSTMDIALHEDYLEFLQLLNSRQIEYLIIGAYAVGYHGYARTTEDLDIWVAVSRENADRLVDALREFAINGPELVPELFLQEPHFVRLGRGNVRIEIGTGISGVRFSECF